MNSPGDASVQLDRHEGITSVHHCAVLGSPIAHSLSPLLHSVAYRRLNLSDWDYRRHNVHADELASFIASLDSTWAGLSLTMPLKKMVMPLGKACDRWSRTLNVANTAVLDWMASPGTAPTISLYNTDVEGIIKALEHAELSSDVTERSSNDDLHDAVVIGSGNTAASAIAAFSALGVRHVDIIARNEAAKHRLRQLCSELSMTSTSWSLDQIPRNISDRRYIVSTLPAHAADSVARLWISESIRLNAVVLDVVYKPRPSMLVNTCAQLGAVAITGEEMLIYQAIPQVALMTRTEQAHMPADLDMTMRMAVQEAIK
ncbi:shikimate dehydrogenase [Bifidobacterium aquikefiricola]|uniref:Shikimate dehydrogenase n=1 Tax=Bifidobacterium aquikefiricola TaxID=3059038 RepID=A0AB39U8Q1_9BIFI